MKLTMVLQRPLLHATMTGAVASTSAATAGGASGRGVVRPDWAVLGAAGAVFVGGAALV